MSHVTPENLWSESKKTIEVLEQAPVQTESLIQLCGVYRRLIAREQRIDQLDSMAIDLLIGLTEPLQALVSHGDLVECTSLDSLTAEGLGIAQGLQKFLLNYHAQGVLYRACNWISSWNERSVETFLNQLDGFDDGVIRYIAKYLRAPASIDRPERERQSNGIALEGKVQEEDKVQVDDLPDVGAAPGPKFNPRDGSLLGRKFVLLNTPILGTSDADVIWKAKNKRICTEVALKFYRVEERFEKECQALKDLGSAECKHIPTIITTFKGKTETEGWESYNCLVMDFCEVPLSEFIHQTRGPELTIHYIKMVISDISDALLAVHRTGYVHCNVKPENVLQKRNPGALVPTWMLVDFDSATRINEPMRMTGGVNYVAPEVAENELLDQESTAFPAIDAYALGRILQFMMTPIGWWPRVKDTDEEKMRYLSEMTEIKVKQTGSVDEHTARAINHLIHRDPDMRRDIERFRNSTFIGGGSDTKEMDDLKKDTDVARAVHQQMKTMQSSVGNISQGMSDIKLGVDTAVNKMDDIMDSVQAMRNQALNMAVNVVPRLFLLIPDPSRNILNVSDWGRDHFTFVFMCECENPHPGYHPGYKLSEPKKFLVKYGPHIRLVLQMTLTAVSVAGKVAGIPTLFPPGTMDALQSIGKSGEELFARVEAFSKKLAVIGTELDKASVVDPVMSQTGGQGKKAYGTFSEKDMRAIEAYLESKDPSRSLGNLRRCTHRKSGAVRWLCDDHLDSGEYLVANTEEE
ncbi:kinase-like domain-containing protein [Piptocephalis cylindrospora]|uniref:Kinase-like domain-containing protein n=1 Tax=Piptocephalis cylindrospora TaxID=1907219 RepID=A0A4P9Y4N1_9FUNG|nr:kinase-like domain-containing protein [Piptocephalis cylindrospora]|eukprot:RKP13875.1 kinase-like domain-containing protein [Piptocephalis cylindrospora]